MNIHTIIKPPTVLSRAIAILCLCLSLSHSSQAKIELGSITQITQTNPCNGMIEIIAMGDIPEMSAGPFTIEVIGDNGTILNEEEVEGVWFAKELCEGTYNILVTNAYGCVTILPPVTLYCTFSTYAPVTQVDCENPGSGRLGINAVGLDYIWTDAFGNYLGNQSVQNVSTVGTYQVEMSNETGCIAFETFDFFPEDIKPYIKKVKITSNGITIYEATWQRTGKNCVVYTGGMVAMSETALLLLLESSDRSYS